MHYLSLCRPYPHNTVMESTYYDSHVKRKIIHMLNVLWLKKKYTIYTIRCMFFFPLTRDKLHTYKVYFHVRKGIYVSNGWCTISWLIFEKVSEYFLVSTWLNLKLYSLPLLKTRQKCKEWNHGQDTLGWSNQPKFKTALLARRCCKLQHNFSCIILSKDAKV